MARNFTLPKFPVFVSIWRSSSWLATFPELPEADVTCKANLVPGQRTQGAEMDTSNLLIPIGTDIRFTEDGTFEELPSGTEDLVEVGTGSGYFYKVYNVERSALGFDNLHLIANLVQVSPVPIDQGVPEDFGVGDDPAPDPDDYTTSICCPDIDIKKVLTGTFSDQAGALACLTTPLTFTWDAGVWVAPLTDDCDCPDDPLDTWTLYCDTSINNWALSFIGVRCLNRTPNINPTHTCTPFSITFLIYVPFTSDVATLTITEAA